MNVNKWTKKLTKSLIEEQCKNNNLSEKETKEIMETLDHSLFIDNQGFKEKIPTIEKKIKESFSYKNNKTYTNATEFMDTPDHVEVFKKVLFDMLNNNELQVFYDNGVLNEGAIFLVYKINEKMIFEYMFCEDDTRRFLMNTEQILFSYPKETKTNDKERSMFLQALLNFNKQDYIFENVKSVVKSDIEFDENFKTNHRKLLFLGYFWRYGIIGLALTLPLIFSVIFKNMNPIPGYSNIVILLSFVVPFIAVGIDYILACILKWPHILLVNQLIHHRKINISDLKWDDISIKEFIIIGSVFIILGLIILFLFIFF